MVIITGDTHGKFDRLKKDCAKRRKLKENDYLIICGDFGGIWFGNQRQEKTLNELSTLPFTILFADGNHENYDLLDSYPVSEWHGGKVQIIRPNIIHLMRGQIYEIEGKKYFVMGGAACHDVWNGILDPNSPSFERKYSSLRKRHAFARIKGISYWTRELPSKEEYDEAWKNLCDNNKEVDIVISHCAPSELQNMFMYIVKNFTYPKNELTDFLQKVYNECSFQCWCCGHYHLSFRFQKFHILYEDYLIVE